MFTSTVTATLWRLFSLTLVLAVTFTDWLIAQTNPDQNAKFWVAGFGGALILRGLLPGLTIRQHITGLLIGTGCAVFWGSDIYRTLHVPGGWFEHWSEFGIWAGVGLGGDIGAQIVALILQLGLKLMRYGYDKPGEALNDGLENGGKIMDFWLRFKAPLVDMFQTIFKRPPSS